MAKTTAPEPSTPTTQPGPTQGADPAVIIARPADPMALETDAAAIQQLSQDNGAGPRQEPIHRQTDPVAEVKLNEDGTPVDPPKRKKHKPTTDEDAGTLADLLIKALETQSLQVGSDSYGREYEFFTTNMNNQSVVMCVIKVDGLAQQMPVTTATLTLETGRQNAIDAIRALDGMLV